GAGERGGSALAIAEAVALAAAVEDDMVAVGLGGEGVAGDGAPAEAASNLEAAGFAIFCEKGSVFAREGARPLDGMARAEIAGDGIVRIAAPGQADLRGSERAA